MKIVIFAGGPLSQKTGDKLAMAGVKFFAAYGSTEGGPNTDIFDVDYSAGPDATVKSKEDWAWLNLTDSMKPRWVPQGDGSYELQLLVRIPPNLLESSDSVQSDFTDVRYPQARCGEHS